MATLGTRLCEECRNQGCCKLKEIYKKNIEIMEVLVEQFKEPEDYEKCFTTDISYRCDFYDWHNNYR